MNGQSVGKAISNSIRPVVVASLLAIGEAQDAEGLARDADGLKTVSRGKPRSKTKPKLWGRQRVVGDGMTGRFNMLSKETCTVFSGSSCAVTPRLSVTRARRARRAGVRAFIVAMKPGNAGGAKGRREVDEE